MEKDNVRLFKPKTEEARELTQEEIAFVVAQDEAELNGYLNKFKTVALPDSSAVQEEDEEEEETVTLDFTEDGVKAYEKVEEGIIARDQDGNISMVDDEDLAARIKEMLNQEKVNPLQEKYNGHFDALIVEKALASLVVKLRNAEDELINAATAERMGMANDILENHVMEKSYSLRQEVRVAIAGGRVHWDKVPTWAEGYIEEYFRNMVSGLTELTERG